MKTMAALSIIFILTGISSCANQSAVAANDKLITASTNSVHECVSLAGRYEARGIDASSSAAIWYSEVAALPKQNTATELRIQLDVSSERLVVQQTDQSGVDVVPLSRIRGRCVNGAWVNEFDGTASADGRFVKIQGKLTFELENQRIVFRYFKKESGISGAPLVHDRTGRFARIS